MSNPTMLYKCPGPYEIHGGNFDCCIVEADEEGAIENALVEGWFKSTPEARAEYEAQQMAMAEGKVTPATKKAAKSAATPPAGAWGAATPPADSQ